MNHQFVNPAQLIAQLKERPDEMYMTDKFMAVYWTALDKVLFITGDFKDISDEEANRILQDRITKITASMN